MKTVDVKTFAQRSIRAWMLAGLLGGGWAMAQEYPPDLRAALIASTESGKTIELKDGRVFLYRQLVELPESQREAILEWSKKTSQRANFTEWVAATAEAQADEAKKGRDTAEATTARSLEGLAGNTRKAPAAGVKLPISFTTFSQTVAGINDHILKAGLSKESADFLKSLLRRPELFAQP